MLSDSSVCDLSAYFIQLPCNEICLNITSSAQPSQTIFFVFHWSIVYLGFLGGVNGKELVCKCRHKRHGFDPWVRKIPWRTAWQPSPVFLPAESHGQKSLAGYSPKRCRVRCDWSDLACTQLIYNAVLASGVQQHDSDIYKYWYTYSFLDFFHYMLL